MSHHTRRLAPPLLAGLLAGLAMVAGGTMPAHADDAAPKILLILDASGSMNGKDPSGTTKIAAAKRALASTVKALPADAEVGLRVFGATQKGGKPTPAACADTQLVYPVGPLDADALTKAVKGFSAKGETPIAYSLAQGVKDLGTDGPRHIILVSDGEESCVPDPCPQVRDLAGAGVTLQIDTVGFGVESKARKQLQCIADAGNGTYYDAKDSDALESSLGRLSTRAIRPFTVRGTPVAGTPQPADAPVLTAGQYTDTFASSTQGAVLRHYVIRRSTSGSTLRAGVVGRMPYGSGFEGVGRGTWDFDLSTTDGKTRCGTSWNIPSDTTGIGSLVSGAVVALPLDPRTASPSPTAVACATASDLLLTIKVGPGSSALDIPIELRVIEEPPVADAADLPAGVADVPRNTGRTPSPASGKPKRVVAGTSFNDALTLEPGTYEVELVPGETTFVRTPIQWGQGAVFAIDGPDRKAPALQSLTGFDYLGIAGNVYAPDASQIDSQELSLYALYNGDLRLVSDPDVNVVPQVRYRNRWDSPAMFHNTSRGFAMTGDYYFSIGLNQDIDSLAGTPIPVRFSFAVTGTPSGAPQVIATPEPSTPSTTPRPSTPAIAPETPEPSTPSTTPRPSTPAIAPETPGTPALPVIGGALVAAGVLGAGGYLVWSRRRRS